MILTKMVSYLLGFVVGLLAIAPPIGYSIPVIVNSYHWLYLLIVSGFLGMCLLFTKIPIPLKILSVFVFISCFISQAPYASFNAYICMIVAIYCYLAFLKCDYQPILNMVAAAFWIEFILTCMQLLGRDTLMCFGSTDKVFLGTIMQYMRFSSLLAIMTPLLILKNKWYIIPILLFCVISKSSSFGLAVIMGVGTYAFMRFKRYRKLGVVGLLICLMGYIVWDWPSISVAFTCGRIPVWGDIIITWFFDTSKCAVPISKNFTSCPIDWKSIFIGRGLDTFLPLFPIFKHDFNPFPQAHNCWLQIAWETGAIGAILVSGYYLNLMRRLKDNPILVAGLVCMGVNMFFAFPTRMTQTMLMMICWVAYCEQTARRMPIQRET